MTRRGHHTGRAARTAVLGVVMCLLMLEPVTIGRAQPAPIYATVVIRGGNPGMNVFWRTSLNSDVQADIIPTEGMRRPVVGNFYVGTATPRAGYQIWGIRNSFRQVAQISDRFVIDLPPTHSGCVSSSAIGHLRADGEAAQGYPNVLGHMIVLGHIAAQCAQRTECNRSTQAANAVTAVFGRWVHRKSSVGGNFVHAYVRPSCETR